jgi:hypothetical protein
MNIKECVICSVVFEAWNKQKKCCSKECKAKKEAIRKAKNREDNKDKINAKRREKYQTNSKFKVYEVERSRKYREENIEKAKLRERTYKKNNRDKVSNYAKERYNKDYNTKLSQVVRSRIRKAIRNKSEGSLELLGANIEEVREHLEKRFKEGMTWENHKLDGWHIDHIRPCASFDLTDPEQQKKCFNYKNLQPLWWWENISKSNKV